MDHAVFAAWIFTVAVAVPVRVLHEAAKGIMMLVSDQVARAFPTLQIAGRVAPSGAGQLALAAEKLQVNRRGRHAIFPQELLGFLELGPNVLARQENLGRAVGIGL